MFTISNNDLRNLEALNLNSNNIKEISDKAFQNVPKLITLNLNQNKITGISPSGFDGIGNLQNLTMSTNKLSSIEMSSLEPLKNLVKFHLDSNRLKELPAVSTYVNISSVVEFQRWWVLKSKLFAQESTCSKEILIPN